MYQINDYVVYRLLTVCQIVNIETPSFERDSTKMYYTLAPVFDNGNNTTVYVPVGAEEGLRPLFSLDTVKKAIAALPTMKATVCKIQAAFTRFIPFYPL